MVAKGFWLIQRILSAFVCRNNVKENQTSIRNERKAVCFFIFCLSLTPVYTDDVTVLYNHIQMQSCYFSQFFRM